jgi:hypothetical protein
MKETIRSNTTDSMPISVAVDSKPQTPITKKTRIFKVLAIHSQWGEQASVRVFKIAANGMWDARNLARTMVCRLGIDQIEAISIDAHDVGEGIEDVEVFDVYEVRYDIPGHVWTREQIDSDDLDALIEQVASESEEATEGGSETSPVVEISRQ